MAIKAPKTRSLMLIGLTTPILVGLVAGILVPGWENTILYNLILYGIALLAVSYFSYLPEPNLRASWFMGMDPALVRDVEKERHTGKKPEDGTLEVMVLGIASFGVGILIVFL